MDERKEIRSYIEDNMSIVDDADFDNDTDIFRSGFVNSFFAMKLLMFVENHFHIAVDDDDIEISSFSTINNIMNFINRKRGSSA